MKALLQIGTTEHYEDAELYDHEYRRRRADVNHYRKVAREMGPDGEHGGRILELGCGTGRLLVPLLRDGHTVVGVDRSLPMLRRCQERIQRLRPLRREQARLIQGDFRSLPLTDEGAGKFPLILCPFNAFMHLYDRIDVERFLSQVRDHLVKGGLFVFDVLLPDLTWLARDPDHRWARTRFRHPRTGERMIYTTNHCYDPLRQIALVRIYYDLDVAAGGDHGAPGPQPDLQCDPKIVHLAHRQFFPAELEALLYYNGFLIERREGGFDGEALTPVSTEQVIRARVR